MTETMSGEPKQPNHSNPSNSEMCSFEEFKMYYESTEKVTDRRLENNRWSYSASVAILLAIAYILNWSISHSEYQFIGYTVTSLLSLMAILFSTFCIGIIRDYKNLNTAKFSIINEMASYVIFDRDDTSPKRVSYKPFEKEWSVLEKLKALQEKPHQNSNVNIIENFLNLFKEIKNNPRRLSIHLPTLKNYLPGLKSTDAEYAIPRTFRLIFLLLFTISTFPIVLKFNLFIQAWKKIMNL